MHNDYSRHLGPAVYLFSNHLEIFSYGNPLIVQTKDDFLRGVSVPINPELTNIFMKIDKTEASGKGVNTIVKKYGIDVFEFSETHLTIKIPYKVKALEITQENTQEIRKDKRITQEITQEIGKDQRITQEITQETIESKILKIIKEEPTITKNILSERLKTSPDSIKYYLNKMRKNGLIKHKGPTKSGYWEIVE